MLTIDECMIVLSNEIRNFEKDLPEITEYEKAYKQAFLLGIKFSIRILDKLKFLRGEE